MKEPYDAKMICTVIESLLGGSAEPVGETNIDKVKLDRQKTEEEIIYWLMDDMFRCFEKKDVYWGSGQIAGERAEIFLQELHETISDYIEQEKEEDEYRRREWYELREEVRRLRDMVEQLLMLAERKEE